MKAALILVTVSWDPTTFPFQIAEKHKDLSSWIIISAKVHDASTKWSWQPGISAIIHHFSRTLEESVSQDQILKNALCLWTKHTPQLGLWSTYRHQFFKELLEHGQSMQWRPWRSRPHRCLWRAHPNWKWTQDSSTAVQCSNCTFSHDKLYKCYSCRMMVVPQ